MGIGTVFGVVREVGGFMAGTGGMIVAEGTFLGLGKPIVKEAFGNSKVCNLCVDLAMLAVGDLAFNKTQEAFHGFMDEVKDTYDTLKKLHVEFSASKPEKENNVIQVKVSDEDREEIEKLKEKMSDLKVVKNDQENVADDGE